MSASREKNKRREEARNPAPVESAAGKKEMSKGLKTTLGVVIAVVVLAIVVFFYMLTSGFFATHTTAAIVGEHKLSPATVNFFYRDAYTYTMNQWGELASYMLDPNTPLDEQVYDEATGKTWADYFLESGLTTASQMFALYDDALANGYKLTEDQESQIDSQIQMMDLYGASYGYTSGDAFINANYGDGCNSKTYREYLYINTVAQEYSNFVNDSYNYTAQDLADEYAANAQNYDTVTYRSFTFNASDYAEPLEEGETLTEEQTAAAMELAKVDADAMVAAVEEGGEEAYLAACIQYATEDNKANYEADEDHSLRSNVTYTGASSTLADWLFDEARQEGDVTCLGTDSYYYVAYYLSRDDHNVTMPNVRRILFQPADTSASTEEGAADAAKAEALEKAEAALAKYKAGEQTEEAFAVLGNEYLASGEAAEATLYEDIYPGQMVKEFESWCYDAARAAGDTAIVETQYGYHVMYFSGHSDKIAKDYLVEEALRSADFTEWQNGIVGEAAYEIVESGMKMVTK